MNISTIKNQFPIFTNNPGLIYLDNASTSQKPQMVIDAIVDFYTKYNANVHRGIYPLSETATELYEAARLKVANFIKAKPEEVIFTSGTTDGINAIASSLVRSNMISSKPNILLTAIEHHSNILPWQEIENSTIEYIPINNEFEIDIDYIDQSTTKFDIASLTYVSNVTGTRIDIKKVVQKLRKLNPNIFIIIDAAQAIAHEPIDVRDLDIDFIVFSGHKMYGPTGIGVLYAKKEILEKMEPFRFGGGMIREVQKNKSTWAPVPEKFEAGTPPIAEAIGLAKAVDFLTILNDEAGSLQVYENELRIYLYSKLKEIEGIKIYHPPINKNAGAVISFTIEKIHPHDIAQFLGDNNICLRAGHHCTQILHRDVLEIPASLRVSLAVYNTKEEIDSLIEKLKEAIGIYTK
jgi:cysteine desulfurase / selenocysteine lyase